MIISVEIMQNGFRHLMIWKNTNFIYLPFTHGSDAWIYVFNSLVEFEQKYPGILVLKDYTEVEQEIQYGKIIETRYLS